MATETLERSKPPTSDAGPGRLTPGPSARIRRLRERYQREEARLSVQRARHYTDGWRATEGSEEPAAVRVALAMKRVYEQVELLVDPDDRIAGHWTEHFIGVPIDIERGVFNSVLAVELRRSSMAGARLGALARGLGYLLRKGGLREFLAQRRALASAGATPLALAAETMDRRAVNRFGVSPADRRILLSELLPYWKGRTLVDRLERELADSGLRSAAMAEFDLAIPGNTSRQVMMLSPCATIASIQGHVIIDYGTVLALGLDGMLERARVALEEARAEARAEEVGCCRALVIALEGVAIFARRLAARLEEALAGEGDEARRRELRGMLEVCRRVPMQPAVGFREAVQALWTVKTAVELAHPVNLHSFGRLDQLLLPHYRRDLAHGRLTVAQASELLEELLLKTMTQNIRPESNILSHFYHRYFGSAPVTVGGLTRDGRDATNELTHLFIEAADNARAVTNLSVRVHPGTPDAVLERVAAGLRAGCASYSLFNDVTHTEAMRRRGFAPEDANDYAIMGCVEATCPGRTGAMSASALLLCRLLDITLRGGDSRLVTGLLPGEGLPTGGAASFSDFEGLLEAFFAQGRHFIDKLATASNLRDQVFAGQLPAPIISAFMQGCLTSRRDVTAGGAPYDLSGISLINAIANVTDALYGIQKLVFERRRFTLPQLLAAVDANFVGHAEVLRELRRLPGKWGNGNPDCDALAARIMQGLLEPIHEHRNVRGGPFVTYAISMTTHTIDGRLSPATPDGRLAGRPFAASCNPYNVERAGVTGALRSVAALPAEELLGSAINVKFHPSAIGHHARARKKWAALVRAYFSMGGPQLQPTVADAGLLRQAQQQPDEHRDLIVKVGGYSTYFVELGREIQDEIIARTTHGGGQGA